jgi:hypothetical protein
MSPSALEVHHHSITLVHCPFADHLETIFRDDLVKQSLDLPATVYTNRQHALEAADLHSALAIDYGDAIRVTECSDSKERQLLLFLGVEIKQGIGIVVGSSVGGS